MSTMDEKKPDQAWFEHKRHEPAPRRSFSRAESSSQAACSIASACPPVMDVTF